MANFYPLTEDDAKWIAENIGKLQSIISNRSRPPQDHSWVEAQDFQAAETFIAKPIRSFGETGTGVSGAIPAMTTPGGTATGSASAPIPGMALCAIYSLLDDGFGTPILMPLGGAENLEDYSRWVYNVQTSSSSSYFPVTKTKDGHWIALIGGGGGASIVRFEITASGPPYKQDTQTCTTVLARVESVICSGAEVAVDDEIIVWDPWGCWFSIPYENLEGMYGMAINFSKDGSYTSECVNDTAEGCFWNVINLCCLEEVFVS